MIGLQIPATSACVLAIGLFGSPALADGTLDPVCNQQAHQFVDMIPNLKKQTGIGSGAELIRDENGRWGLAASVFSHSAEQFAGKHGDEYWAKLLFLSDGLLGCFDGDKTGPNYRDVTPTFEAQFQKERRIEMIATALLIVSNGDQ